MLRTLLLALAATTVGFALIPTAMAQSGANVIRQDDAVRIVFDEIEKRVIRDYFGDHDDRGGGHGRKDKGKGKAGGKGGGLPPGLAKRESLPPGLQRQLRETGRLPPGLEKQDLPQDLLSRLPRPKRGTERVIVGSDVVLLKAGTNIILDILQDALKGAR